MTIENTVGDQVETDKSKTGGDQSTVELDALKADLEEIRAEAAKQRGIAKAAIAERDKLKKQSVVKDTDEDYKKLWDDANQKLSTYQTKVKAADIKAAVMGKLNSSKVQDDKLVAALKLVDHEMIEWDEDVGVDSKSVTAAVQKLKTDFGWLFETKLVPTQLKNPTEGSSDGKTILRAEFDRLSAPDRHRKIVVDKFQVVDS